MGRVAEAVWVVVGEVDTEIEVVKVVTPEVARGDALAEATSVVATGLGDVEKLSSGTAVVAI